MSRCISICGIDARYVKGIYVYDEYCAGQIGRKCRELLYRQKYYVLGSMGNAGPAGAEQLGLQGSVDKDVLPVFWRKLPDGADLSRMQDGSNKHRPGYDLTFSAPKVSP